MVYLQAENLTKSFGERVLFQGINLTISQGQKVALVARNGAGKTSLLRILAGKDISDEGEVRISKEITLGYLEQSPELEEGKTVLETVLWSENPILSAIQQYESTLLLHAESASLQSEKALQEASNKMDSLNAWEYEQRVKQILTHLEISNLNQMASTLSGGQKKRVALAKILIQAPELMILDEPTNHLDLEMVEWLEKYLSRQKMSLLLVTHDRYFLDRITDEILELDGQELLRYKGNYAYYLEKKAERAFMQSREVEKAQNLYRKELDWMRRMPKARSTKAKSRIDAFYETEEKAHQKTNEQKLTLDVKMSRVGGKILEVKHLQKSYGDLKIVDGFTYTFSKGERIGIVGPNGVGKSTFLNMLTGREEPDGGKINTGETTIFGYYTQEGIQLAEDKRIIEVVKEIAEVIPLGSGDKVTAQQFLQHFGFEPSVQYTPVSKLSGGERRRLHLMTVLMKNPNFLILDEPTNDLDLLTLTVLEEFLVNFQGCLLIVSHDRYFMDKLVNHLFIFQGEGVIKDFNGTYADYRDLLEEEERETKKEAKAAEPAKVAQPVSEPQKRKLSYKEKREYEELESQIAGLEEEKSALEAKMASGEGSHLDFETWAKRLQEINNSLDVKMDRWLELSEYA